MKQVTLYRVKTDKGVIITPNKPNNYDSTLIRLIADDGMELVKDGIRTTCIDVDSIEGWIEVEAKETD